MIRSKRLFAVGGLWLATCASLPVSAQYAQVPEPSFRPAAPPSPATDPKDYKLDVARHMYATYARHIYRGVMPPMLNAVMITETRIDPSGQVMGVEIKREPAEEKEAMAWATAMIKAASPYPAPVNFGPSGAVVREIWLIHRSVRGRSEKFQLDSLGEGQKATPPSCPASPMAQGEGSSTSAATIVAPAGSDKGPLHWAAFTVEERAQGAGYALARNVMSIERAERGIPALGQDTEVGGPLGRATPLGNFKTVIKWEDQTERSARYQFNNAVTVSGSAREMSELKERDLPASASYVRIVAKTPLQVTWTSSEYSTTGSGEAFLMQLRESTDPCTHEQTLEIKQRTAFPAKRPIRQVLNLPVGEHRLAWGVGIKRTGGSAQWTGSLLVEAK